VKKFILFLTLLSLPLSGYAIFGQKEDAKLDALHRKYVEKKLFIKPTQEGKSLAGAILKWGSSCTLLTIACVLGIDAKIKDDEFTKAEAVTALLCAVLTPLSYFLTNKYIHKPLCFKNKCVETFRDFIAKWPEHEDSTPVALRKYFSDIYENYTNQANPDDYIEAIAAEALKEIKGLISQE
jgi:hypothetical protein